MLPVLPRLPDAHALIERKFYFILHAPRQSGKTTFLENLTDDINSKGKMYALTVCLSALQSSYDREVGLNDVIDQLNEAMLSSQVEIFHQKVYAYNKLAKMAGPTVMVKRFLNLLCEDLDKDLVIFFDEADCLQEAPLMPFLSQIRDGYNMRHKKGNNFPRSMVMAGMRDIRDYLSQVRPDEQSKGIASPFNVKKDALTLSNFTKEQIRDLYGQHTEATGQIFDESSVAQAWYWSEGQPWLVNALAYHVVDKELQNDYSVTIASQHIDQAAHSLILSKDTHFDSLQKRLSEPRVRRVIEAAVIGAADFPVGISPDDIQYALDLGLLKIDPGNSGVYLPANPVYQEIIVRTLTYNIQRKIKKSKPVPDEGKWMDGSALDMSGLLKSFQTYWSENSEMFINYNKMDSLVSNSISSALLKFSLASQIEISEDIINNIENSLISLTNEALTHLVLFAFLQRVLNGGADFIHREYALGTLRADILVSYKGRRYPVEIKIKGNASEDESLEQLFGYMNKCGAEVGWLVVFDKNFDKPWNEKIFWDTREYKGAIIHIAGC
jgi:hypothetical protein